jgi:hypothetical protein
VRRTRGPRAGARIVAQRAALREVAVDARARRYFGLERRIDVDKALAYLISAGIVAFGVWIIVHAIGSDASLVWTLLGILPVLVGLISLCHEARLP